MPNSRHFLRVLFLVTVLTSPAAAGWINYPNANLPVCTAGGDQYLPRAVSDGSGGAIVVWDDRRGDGDIYAQHVLGSGAVDSAWPGDGRAVCATAGAQDNATIISDGAGGVLVAWSDARNGTVRRVFAQHVLASGALDAAWPTNGRAVSISATDQQMPAIASDGAGGALITWVDDRGVYAQHILPSGAVDPVWPTDGACLATRLSYQQYPVIVPDGAGGAVVAWTDLRSGADWDIYAQHFIASGAIATSWPAGGLAVSVAGGNQSQPAIVADGLGGAIISWLDARSGSAIYAQHVLASGGVDPAWTFNGRSLCSAPGEKSYLSSIADGAGGAFVTWSDARGGTNDIYAQRVSAAGGTDPLWPLDGRAVCIAPSHQYGPVAAPNGAGGIIIAWMDARNVTYDIYAQRLTAAGALEWSGGGVPVCTAANTQASLTLVPDNTGGAIIAWCDNRVLTSYDIYAQRISATGGLGETSVAPAIFGARDIPNDQGGKLKLMWDASLLDAEPYNSIADYRIWRSVPSARAQRALASGATIVQPDERHVLEPGRSFRAEPSATGIVYWEYFDTQVARRFAGYSMVISTTGDSIAGSNPFTLYLVEARHINGAEFFDSAPDSGYSVDNLAPPIPFPFYANYAGADVALHWVPSPVVDFREFRLHRGGSIDFVPGPSNLIYAGPDTGHVDRAGIGGFYKLAAADIHGNIGRFALVSPTVPTSTLASLVSSEWTGTAASLVWYGAGLSGLGVSVYRSEGDSDWTQVTQLFADGEGYVRYSDASVLPRRRYSYRLGILEEGIERFAGETSLEIPGGRLEIRAVASNPVRGDALSFVVTLASSEPVSSRVLDLAGRVVREQVVQPDLSGRLTISLGAGARLRPGVYLLELRQGNERAVTRFTYLR